MFERFKNASKEVYQAIGKKWSIVFAVMLLLVIFYAAAGAKNFFRWIGTEYALNSARRDAANARARADKNEQDAASFKQQAAEYKAQAETYQLQIDAATKNRDQAQQKYDELKKQTDAFLGDLQNVRNAPLRTGGNLSDRLDGLRTKLDALDRADAGGN